MNQNQRYETAYQNSYASIHNFSTSNTWSKEEKRLFQILSQNKKQTIFSEYIRQALSGRSMGAFRKLIKELHEQSLVAKKELTKAIGSEAVGIIETLSSLNDPLRVP